MGYLHINNTWYDIGSGDAVALFQAIALIQTIPGCEDAVSSLTPKLEECFKDIKPKDNKKTIGKIEYYSNGLIKGYVYGINGKVIASPWVVSDTVKEKAYDLKSVERVNMLWAYQIKVYLKRRFSSTVYHDYNLATILRKMDANVTLDEGIPRVVSPDLDVSTYTIDSIYNKISSMLCNDFEYNYNYYGRRTRPIYKEHVIVFLSETDIEYILNLYKMYYDPVLKTDKNDNIYNSVKELMDRLKKTSKNIIPIDLYLHVARSIEKGEANEFGYRQQYDNPAYYVAAGKKIRDIYIALNDVTDPNVRKVFTNLGIIKDGWTPLTNEQFDVAKKDYDERRKEALRKAQEKAGCFM